MNYAIVPLCDPKLIINYDASQYEVGYDGDKLTSCVLIKDDDSKTQKTRKDKGQQGLTSYFIKWFCLITAYWTISMHWWKSSK
jgi:hypothetical protein